MEPGTSTPKVGPEQAPPQFGSVEHVPQLPLPERGPLETGTERKEQASELTFSQSSDDGAAVVTPVLPTPIATDDPATDNQTIVASPAVAGDDDLIEKEWVDRAKKIVSDTKDDPYKQENAVSQLQKDYLKKRYGRELGEAQ